MLFAMGDDFSYGLNTLGPLCLWQCFLHTWPMSYTESSLRAGRRGRKRITTWRSKVMNLWRSYDDGFMMAWWFDDAMIFWWWYRCEERYADVDVHPGEENREGGLERTVQLVWEQKNLSGIDQYNTWNSQCHSLSHWSPLIQRERVRSSRKLKILEDEY